MMRSAILVLGAAIATYSNAQTPPPCTATQCMRTSAFEYQPGSGLLIREIVEPDVPELCLVTVYDLDNFGNRIGTTTRNCNGSAINDGGNHYEAAAPACTTPPLCAAFAQRNSTTSFAVDTTINTVNLVPGQFPILSKNGLLHQEVREFHAGFGALTRLTGPNNLATTWEYDDLGRKHVERRNAGTASETTTTWDYELCSSPPQDTSPCPQFGVYRVRVTTPGALTTSTCYDSLNRAIRTETQGFDGSPVFQDTRYDALGRVAMTSRPFVTEGLQVWTKFTYDTLGRVTQVDEPAVNGAALRTTTDYSYPFTTVTVSNAGSGTTMPEGVSQVRITKKNSQGQVVEITQQ